MYLYKSGAGHQGRNSNLAALHESDSGPMELTELKEIPHNRTGILLHNVRLNPQETRKERTHGHLSVLCIMTHSNSNRSLNCPLSPYFGIPRPMINQTDAGKITAKDDGGESRRYTPGCIQTPLIRLFCSFPMV